MADTYSEDYTDGYPSALTGSMRAATRQPAAARPAARRIAEARPAERRAAQMRAADPA